MLGGTIVYMEGLAENSFNRQADLDESVWRSLPFFAASLGLAATIIGHAAADTPNVAWSTFAVVTNLLLLGSIGCFGWALRWFWEVVRGRDYEIPASDARVRKYAEELTEFYTSSDLEQAAVDKQVVEDLRLFMIDQYASAAASNFLQNARKTSSRSQVLLYMLAGFVLAFACEAVIFLHREAADPRAAAGGSNLADTIRSGIAAAQSNGTCKANPAAGSVDYGRRFVWERVAGATDSGEVGRERTGKEAGGSAASDTERSASREASTAPATEPHQNRTRRHARFARRNHPHAAEAASLIGRCSK